MFDTNIFKKLQESISNIDPVHFCSTYLNLDGKPFSLDGNGYKPFKDIYRYIGVKALDKYSKPVVLMASRQVGKTTLACGLEMYFMGSGLFGINGNPPIRVLHAFPEQSFVHAYSKTKLQSMIASSNVIEAPKPGHKPKSFMQSLLDSNNDSLGFKQFQNGNLLWIDSVGFDGDRIRGRTLDVIFFDEVQDMREDAIAASIKTLNKAQYGEPGTGVQLYTGTPKMRGSHFWKMWTKAHQHRFYLKCEACDKLFPLYHPGVVDWEEVWLYKWVVKCTHCSHEQDKRKAAENGSWVADPESANEKFIGFHINQLYMPEFSKERILQEKPGIHPSNGERMFQNEVLGEFYQGEAGIITLEELIKSCGMPEIGMKNSYPDNPQIPSFMGIDIGGKADLETLAGKNTSGQSFSTAVIIHPEGDDLVIDFAHKFPKNDFEHKKSIIKELIKRYNTKLTVCDIGHADALCETLHTEYGGRFITSRAGDVKTKVKWVEDVFPPEIRFSKDFYIEEIYEKMKNGKIKIPLKQYDNIFWLLQHFCNYEIKPSVSRSGDVSAKYVKAGNVDGFSALMNAYLAYKFYISEKFTIKNPLLMGISNKKDKPLVIAGYVPHRL